MFSRAGAALVLALVATVTPAAARNINMMDMFGGFMAVAQQQAAREAWSKAPPSLRLCMDRALRSQGASLDQLIAMGAPIGHPALAPLLGECARFDEAQLQRRFKCNLLDEAGNSVATTCVHAFAQATTVGRPVPMTVQEAIDAHFSRRGEIVLVEVEAEEAGQERRARARFAERSQRLAELQREIAPFERSPLPGTRAEAGRLKARITRAAGGDPADVAVDSFAWDLASLKRLAEEEEAERIGLEKLRTLDADAKARTRDDVPADLRKRLSDLHAQYAALAAPPELAPSPPPKTASNRKISPSFDCAASDTPLKRLICSGPALASADMEVQRAYYAARHAAPDQVEGLKADYIELARKATDDCRLSQPAPQKRGARRDPAECVLRLYRLQAKYWKGFVERFGPAGARQELARPLPDHVDLQAQLQTLGFLPVDAEIDGIYGSTTRRAIEAFQGSVLLDGNGFMSAATSEALAAEAARAASRGSPADTGRAARLSALQQDYARYIADLAPIERERQVRRANLARLNDQRALALRIAEQPIAGDLRAFLSGFAAAAPAGAELADTEVVRLVQEFERWRPRVEAATQLLTLVTDRNRFAFAGDDPRDLLVLYNTTPRSHVTLGLSGDLIFEAKVEACVAFQALPDRTAGIVLGSTLRRIGFKDPPAPKPCATDQFDARDIVIVQPSVLLQQPIGRVRALAGAIDAGTLAHAATVPDSAVRAMREADLGRIAEAEAAVRERREGAAVLVLDNAAATVCQVSSGETYDRSFGRLKTRLSEDVGGALDLAPMTPESAFLAAKRSQCRAVYGSFAALASLIQGLERDGVGFRYLPLFVSAADLESEALAIAQERDAVRDALMAAHREREREAAQRQARLVAERFTSAASAAGAILPVSIDLHATLSTVVDRMWAASDETPTDATGGGLAGLAYSVLGSRPGGLAQAAREDIALPE